MTPKQNLYPLLFEPIFKEKIWGGQRLKTELNKAIPTGKIGESWEISAVEDDYSVVKNGPFSGQSLEELLQKFQEDLVGKSVYRDYQNHFPLLVKFIDASEKLSVQLHPDDELALKRHDSFGKTEMWHILHAQENSYVINGFKKGVTRGDYLKKLEEGELEQILHKEKVSAGDTIFIKPGLIHSIGKGILLAEIQQTSDITYRVFDWNRVDRNGESRQLHTDLAIDAIDFKASEQTKIAPLQQRNQFKILVQNKYFTTRQLHIQNQKFEWNQPEIDSFVVLMCTKGHFILKSGNYQLKLNYGETVLIPAEIKQFTLEAEESELLAVTV
jgi:mannose-6-phosphate isomerase